MLKHQIKSWFTGVSSIRKWPTSDQVNSGCLLPMFGDWSWIVLANNECVLFHDTGAKDNITELDVFPLPKIYIAGPMTGYDDFNRAKFNEKADILRQAGHIVLNPAILPDGLTQSQYMDISLAMLRSADVVHMLSGYAQSPGACVELALAKKTGMKVTYD